MKTKFSTFFSLPFSHQLGVVKAWGLLVLVNTSLKLKGFKKTRAFVEKFYKNGITVPDDAHSAATRISNLTYLASMRLPFTGECLARTLVANYLNRRAGIESEMFFGSKNENGQFEAHAWIEVDGKPIGHDGSRKSEFTSFSTTEIPAKNC